MRDEARWVRRPLAAIGGVLFLAGLLAGVLSALPARGWAQSDAPASVPGAASDSTPRVTILKLDGPVEPTVARYLTREIAAADERGDEAVIIEIDTPGGLVDSMKSIVQTILAADTPIVTYVAPQGARSASAGLYIMYASHIAAMAPATNTGSATPIQMGGAGEDDGGNPFGAPPAPAADEEPDEGGGTDEDGAAEPGGQENGAPADNSNPASLRGKIIEDAVAYIRSLAELRDRNAEWAEKAVRPPSASITATEALELGVIEIVADDRAALIAALDGRKVDLGAEIVVIDTEGAAVTEEEPTRIERILSFFANPNVAAILMTLGTTGIIVEFWNPGSILPGVVGVVSLILAFYSFQILPFNGLFLALMGIGALLIVVELFTPTLGLAGLSGLGLFSVGLYYLFPGEIRVAPGLVLALVLSAGVLLALTAFAFRRSRDQSPMTGTDGVVGSRGLVVSWQRGEGVGEVTAEGERWRAESDGDFGPGDRVTVTGVDGLTLTVSAPSAPGQDTTSSD